MATIWRPAPRIGVVMSLPTQPSREFFHKAISDAYIVRYVTAAGVVALLYDHVLTIHDENRLVWRAPHSLAKFGFLLNRYLVLTVSIIVIQATCGFSSYYTDEGCKITLVAVCINSAISAAIVNILLLLRVLFLWRESKSVRILLYGTYILSSCATISLMVFASMKLLPKVRWMPAAEMCAVNVEGPLFGIALVAPMFFELNILLCVIYNTLSAPRPSHVSFSQALRRDGLVFFLSVTMLRITNVIVAFLVQPRLRMSMAHILWVAITVVVNRSFLRMREVELGNENDMFSVNREASQFKMSDCEMAGFDVQRRENSEATEFTLKARLHSHLP